MTAYARSDPATALDDATESHSTNAPHPLGALDADVSARAEERIALHLLTMGVEAKGAFLFSADEVMLTAGQPVGSRPMLHDDILHAQALMLASHVTGLQGALAIDDIYAHPLIRRCDVLSGHRLRAFLGAPIRMPGGDLAGVLCAIDTITRRWSRQDSAIAEQIVAQIEAHHLSQF